MSSGPVFIRFFWPILAALRELGGSAKPREVVDLVIERLEIPDDERAERTKSGSLRVVNQVHWARNYLAWAGLLDGSQRGRWALSAKGWEVPLEQQHQQSAFDLFKQVRVEHRDEWGRSSGDDASDDAESEETPVALDEVESGEIALTTDLRSIVLALSPAGFENLCKRLLTELGLVQLRTVGQAGDRGIDIEGHLRVNAVVTFRVGVQCKLYSDGNKVTPRQIREFQGALGPYDRGIFMTTSVFTQQAEDQAASPGYKPIDLIDGERLIELLQENGLGIRRVTLVDHSFFAPFR
ncbi:MAG: restriction endonuclease [Acidimicrobiales bacterium]